MQSTAPDVDAYLAAVPAERRDVLAAIRRLCRDCLPDHVEGMLYGMPTYSRDGVPEFAFASQKQYISLYGMKPEAVAAVRDAFAGAKIGKGCIRYAKPDTVDLAAVERLLKATAE